RGVVSMGDRVGSEELVFGRIDSGGGFMHKAVHRYRGRVGDERRADQLRLELADGEKGAMVERLDNRPLDHLGLTYNFHDALLQDGRLAAVEGVADVLGAKWHALQLDA